jgi:hypothetical protein
LPSVRTNRMGTRLSSASTGIPPPHQTCQGTCTRRLTVAHSGRTSAATCRTRPCSRSTLSAGTAQVNWWQTYRDSGTPWNTEAIGFSGTGHRGEWSRTTARPPLRSRITQQRQTHVESCRLPRKPPHEYGLSETIPYNVRMRPLAVNSDKTGSVGDFNAVFSNRTRLWQRRR